MKILVNAETTIDGWRIQFVGVFIVNLNGL